MNLLSLKSKLSSIAHVLYGIITSFAPWYLAIIMGFMFALYELDEEMHIKDRAYKDIREYMLGLVIGAIIYIGLNSIV
ncbi:MAG: hypothetical protein CBR30_09745 [Dictyoglomus sp. NZ13-RE01]|nr:MAG: hypothetical protein CBR30_09745 [Dictyoglomus sp. NZ13-RE01]